MVWKMLNHTADAGLEISAPSWSEVFSQAAEAFFSVCLEETPSTLRGLKEGRCFSLRIEALDLEELAVSWLNELLFLLEIEGAVFYSSALSVTEEPVTLTAEGVLVTGEFRRIPVKAATYGGILLRSRPEPFLRIYLDL